MTEFLHLMDVFFTNLTEKYGYFGVFIGSFLDVVFPIVPSEVIMGLAGNYIAIGKLQFLPVLLVSLAGNLSAATLMWYLGKTWGHGLIEKYGKYLKFTHEDFLAAEDKFNKYGFLFVFGSQCIPLMRSLITIPAGILELGYKKYILCIACGSILWSSMLLYLGITFRGNSEAISKVVKQFGYPVLGIVIIGLIYLVYVFYMNKKIKNQI